MLPARSEHQPAGGAQPHPTPRSEPAGEYGDVGIDHRGAVEEVTLERQRERDRGGKREQFARVANVGVHEEGKPGGPGAKAVQRPLKDCSAC